MFNTALGGKWTRACSPIHYVDRIKARRLIVRGADDPKVAGETNWVEADLFWGASAGTERTPARETGLGPVVGAAVVLGHGRRARRQHHPGLLRLREYMDVRRQAVRLIERADTDEAHMIAGACVVAPKRDPARD